MEDTSSRVVAANCIRDDLRRGYGDVWSVTRCRDHSSHRAVDNEGICHSNSYRDALIRQVSEQFPCHGVTSLLKCNRG